MTDIRYFSNSEIQTFMRCRRKWWLGWSRRLKPAHERQDGVRRLGTRIHEALRLYYDPETQMDAQGMLGLFRTNCMQDIEALNDVEAFEEAEKVRKDMDLGLKMLEGYIEWVESEGEDARFTRVAAEQQMAARLVPGDPGSPWLIGKLDAIMRDEQSSRYMFLDHKSVGSFSQATSMLQMDPQMRMYRLIMLLSSTYGLESPPDDLAGEAQLAVPVRVLPRTNRTVVHPQGSAGSTQIAGDPSQGRGSVEQRVEQPGTDALRLSQSAPQQGSNPNVQRSAQSQSFESDEGPADLAAVDRGTAQSGEPEVDGQNANTGATREHQSWDRSRQAAAVFNVDGAIYNMLRRVKRTATAKPPFYQRVEIRHNLTELRNYWMQISSVIREIGRVERELATNANHHGTVPPSPRSDCSWSCDFYHVCPLFDDGSQAELMIDQLFVESDPLDRYTITDLEKGHES